MLPPAPHYEPNHDFIKQGDIGFFPFTQLLRPDEGAWVPGSTGPPTVRGVPVFDGMTETNLRFAGVDYLLRHWHGLGVVIDVTSEIVNSPEDSRVTVAALVPREAIKMDWTAAERLQLAGVLPLPEAERGSISTVPEFPEADWPNVVLTARSLTTLSRGIVERARIMSLTPQMAILLVSKLSEMFGARQWVRMRHFANVQGQVLAQVDDIGTDQPPPTAGKWAVLTFANGERMQVFVNPKD